RRPLARDAFGRFQLERALVRRVEWMDLAVLGRDVEDAHLLTPAAAIRIRAHHDAHARLERVRTEPVDQRLRNREPFAFDQRAFAVRADRVDDQIDVRILPIVAMDRPFDQDFLRGVEHRLAVMGEDRRGEGHGRCKNPDSRGSELHLDSPRQARTEHDNDSGRVRPKPGKPPAAGRSWAQSAAYHIRSSGTSKPLYASSTSSDELVAASRSMTAFGSRSRIFSATAAGTSAKLLP